MRTFRRGRSAFVAAAIGLFTLTSPALAQTPTLEDLQAIIQQQQQQLEALQQQMDVMQKKSDEMATAAEEARRAATAAQGAVGALPGDGALITSGQEKVRLAISGQVNRLVNVVDDGTSTTVYHADNDNSSTRVRFIGEGDISSDVTVGANIEFEIESNSTADISQQNQSAGTATFKDRKLEAYFTSKRFGKISIGQGDTASNNTAETDLSGTSVIGYSAIGDLAGGMIFRRSESDFTSITVNNAFSNFDGLSRKDRLRYDTPTFYGFSLAGSAVEDDQFDLAAFFGGGFTDVKLAASGGWARPSGTTDDRVSGSISGLHEPTGLNLTVAGGGDQLTKVSNRSDPYFGWVKGGWKASFFDLGGTNLSLDYYYGDKICATCDSSQSVGGFIVQNIADFGTEVYGGFRVYNLEFNDGTADPDDLVVGTFGTRVKF